MSLEAQSRRRTERHLDRLRAEYDGFEVREKRWEFPTEAYERSVKRFEDEAVTGGAGIWIRNDRDEVLLVRNEGEDGWADPGGKVEPDETLEEAAHREVYEEAGVECEITGLLQAHVIETYDEDDLDRPPVVGLIAIFEGEYKSGTPTPAEGEIADVRWWSELPNELRYPDIADYSLPGVDE